MHSHKSFTLILGGPIMRQAAFVFHQVINEYGHTDDLGAVLAFHLSDEDVIWDEVTDVLNALDTPYVIVRTFGTETIPRDLDVFCPIKLDSRRLFLNKDMQVGIPLSLMSDQDALHYAQTAQFVLDTPVMVVDSAHGAIEALRNPPRQNTNLIPEYE